MTEKVKTPFEKALPWLVLVALVVALGFFLSGCTAMDEAMVGPDGETYAGSAAETVEQVVAVATGYNPGIAAIVGGAFALYQLVRKRSREGWVNAVKAVLPMPSDPSIRVGDAIKHVDNALGGGHTSTQPTA